MEGSDEEDYDEDYDEIDEDVDRDAAFTVREKGSKWEIESIGD